MAAGVLRDLIEHSELGRLPEGFHVPVADVIIQRKLGSGGEGHSYLAVDDAGDEKVVKFVTSTMTTTVESLEEKTSRIFRQANRALGLNKQAFIVNPLDIAIVGDYIPGKNLEEEVFERGRPFREGEVVDFLMQLVQGDVASLHEEGLVHRDIKPKNIICNDGEYRLIDFGIMREEGSSMTQTATVRGSPGYTLLNGKNEPRNDLYSLARTAYFLLTGNDPISVGVEEYDVIEDRKIFSALDIDRDFRKLLFRMLGHKKDRYTSCSEVAEDLQKVMTSVARSTAIVNLDTAQKLAKRREAAMVPAELTMRSTGLIEEFRLSYRGRLPDREPLEADFRGDLELTLIDLGYEQHGNIFMRRRKDSKKIDVLQVNTEGKKYFQFYRVKSEERALALAGPYNGNELLYSAPKAVAKVVFPLIGTVISAPLIMVIFRSPYAVIPLTLVSGVAQLYAAHRCNTVPTTVARKRQPKRSRLDSYAYGLNIVEMPHVAGRVAYSLLTLPGRIRHRLGRGFRSDTKCLEKALEPAPYFTYERLEGRT